MTLHYRSLPDLSGLVDTSIEHSFTALHGGPWSAAQHAARAKSGAFTSGGAYMLWGKRALDVILASAVMVLSLPILAILAAALFAEGGNPFFSQTRIGRDGRVFRMFKLRTMVPGAESKLAACLERDPAMFEEWARTQKLRHDPRITPVGRVLRMTSLDELPQIFNVLMGDMSLVGPRPMLPEQLPQYQHPAAYLSLSPGITGLWQVTARSDESFAVRAEIDAVYAQRVTLWRDLRILAATVGAVFMATGR